MSYSDSKLKKNQKKNQIEINKNIKVEKNWKWFLKKVSGQEGSGKTMGAKKDKQNFHSCKRDSLEKFTP